MKIKTSELIGPALDWAVTWAQHPSGPTGEGWYERDADGKLFDPLNECTVSPSTIWEQGGPIIEREEIDIAFDVPSEGMWRYAQMGVHKGQGSTPLIAAMRCYVASKLGDEVDVPKELI